MSSLRFVFPVLGLILLTVSTINFIVLYLTGVSGIREYQSAPTATLSPQTVPSAASQSVSTAGAPATVVPAATIGAVTAEAMEPPTNTPVAAAPAATIGVVTAEAMEPPTDTPAPVAPAATAEAVTVMAPEAPTGTPMPVPPTPAPPVESQMRLWFRSRPVAPLGAHVVQPREHLFCIARAYGVLPQAIAEVNFLALDGRLFDGQPLQIPDVPWVNIPPGPICAPQFKSPYSPPSVSMITPPPSLFLGSRAVSGGPWWGGDDSISGELRLINFVLPRDQVKNVGSQLVSPAVTPTPVLTGETRIVRAKWPVEMVLGESDVVSLTLDLDPTSQAAELGTSPPGQTTATAETSGSGETITYSQPLVIPDVFDHYDISATARLDAAGFSYSPLEKDVQPVNKGEPVTWHWTIKPQDAGQQELIMSLRLHFEPKPKVEPGFNNGPLPRDGQIWAAPFDVNVRKSWFDFYTGIVVAVLGIISTSLPIWDRFITKT